MKTSIELSRIKSMTSYARDKVSYARLGKTYGKTNGIQIMLFKHLSDLRKGRHTT